MCNVFVCAAESMEFSLDADSPINTPVLPCTPDFYLSHCHQVKYFSLPGQLNKFAVTYSVMFYPLPFEKYLPSVLHQLFGFNIFNIQH